MTTKLGPALEKLGALGSGWSIEKENQRPGVEAKIEGELRDLEVRCKEQTQMIENLRQELAAAQQ